MVLPPVEQSYRSGNPFQIVNSRFGPSVFQNVLPSAVIEIAKIATVHILGEMDKLFGRSPSWGVGQNHRDCSPVQLIVYPGYEEQNFAADLLKGVVIMAQFMS